MDDMVEKLFLGKNVSVIQGYEVEDINSKDFVNNSVSYAEDTSITPGMMTAEDVQAYNSLHTNLHLRQLSCAMKHVAALRRIAELPEGHVGLVLEDDVQYTSKTALSKVMEACNALVNTCKDGSGIAFLGFPIASNDDSGLSDFFATFKFFPPSVESYLVTPKAAKLLSESILPIRYMYHVHLGYMLKKLQSKIDAYVFKPSIFLDGSKAGAYLSSLLSQAHLIYNNDYMKVHQLLSDFVDGKVSATDKNNLASSCMSVINASAIKEHPAMLHLQGKVHAILLDDIGSARSLFEKAYEDITQQDAYINNETLILKDLIRSYAPAWNRI